MATGIQIVFDCAHPDKLAGFWAAALGYVKQPPPEGYATWAEFLKTLGIDDPGDRASAVVDPAGAGPRLYFQQVPEPKTVKNRVHLDLNVSERHRVGAEEGQRRIDAEVERLVGLGATRLRAYDEHGETWTVMQDPEGNEFCIQ